MHHKKEKADIWEWYRGNLELELLQLSGTFAGPLLIAMQT